MWPLMEWFPLEHMTQKSPRVKLTSYNPTLEAMGHHFCQVEPARSHEPFLLHCVRDRTTVRMPGGVAHSH